MKRYDGWVSLGLGALDKEPIHVQGKTFYGFHSEYKTAKGLKLESLMIIDDDDCMTLMEGV